jgi:hypothetical protein
MKESVEEYGKCDERGKRKCVNARASSGILPEGGLGEADTASLHILHGRLCWLPAPQRAMKLHTHSEFYDSVSEYDVNKMLSLLLTL